MYCNRLTMYAYGSRARATLRASVHRTFASMSGMQRTESFDLRHVFQEQRGQIDSSRQHYPPVPFPQPRKRGRPRKEVVTSTSSAPMKKMARVLSRAEDQEDVQGACKITMNGKMSSPVDRFFWGKDASAEPGSKEEDLQEKFAIHFCKCNGRDNRQHIDSLAKRNEWCCEDSH